MNSGSAQVGGASLKSGRSWGPIQYDARDLQSPVGVEAQTRFLSASELAALREFFELLDEWDQEAKGGN